jgi:hypothetical protein
VRPWVALGSHDEEEHFVTSTDVLETFKQLPEDEKEVAAAAIAASRPLPPPPEKVVGPLWLIAVSAFAIVLVGGTLGLFLLIADDKETEVIVPLVTAALGVLAGLLAPSPATGSREG